MDFDKDKLLEINESDLNFVATYSIKNESISHNMDKLLKEIRSNIWGCDLLLCFFLAAVNSSKSDRCVRPFPPFYVDEEGKNFTALRITCDSIPALSTILDEPNKCSSAVEHLLTWLFLEKRHPIMKRISFASVPCPGQIGPGFKPQFIFELSYNDKFESIWQKRKDGRDTIFAYHGSSVDNFYSIVTFGLQQHFSTEREVLFGCGIYLSNELTVSAHYAPFRQTWDNSALGTKHSVIAICEIIDDVGKVKCKDAKNKGRAASPGSFSGSLIPEKYFVVTDSDMVRVKYLMVYRQKQGFSATNYLKNHSFLCTLLLYFVLFIAIRIFSNSSYFKY